MGVMGSGLELLLPSIVSLTLYHRIKSYLLIKWRALGFVYALIRPLCETVRHQAFIEISSISVLRTYRVFAWELRESGYSQSKVTLGLSSVVYIERWSFSRHPLHFIEKTPDELYCFYRTQKPQALARGFYVIPIQNMITNIITKTPYTVNCGCG